MGSTGNEALVGLHPWFDTQKSGFVAAFSMFWNSWCANENVVVVICGSAASWIIEQVVNDRGGLHNRITRRIELKPFTLYETYEWRGSKTEPGFQIDLVLDRKDQTINLFEFKFYQAATSLNAADAALLRERRELFREKIKTNKHLFISLLTTFGIMANEHSIGIVDHNLDMRVLFSA